MWPPGRRGSEPSRVANLAHLAARFDDPHVVAPVFDEANFGRGKSLAVNPGEPANDPVLEPVDLLLVGGADEPAWMHKFPQCRPAFIVAGLGFAQFGGPLIDPAQNI